MDLRHTHGEWSGWLLYFLAAVRDAARSAIEQSQSLLKLRDRLRAKLSRRRKALALLDHLYLNPYTNISGAVKRLGVSWPTARIAIQLLEAAGAIAELPGRDWGRIWFARPIVRIVEQSVPIRAARPPGDAPP